MDYTISHAEKAKQDLAGINQYIVFMLHNETAANDYLKLYSEKLVKLIKSPLLYPLSRSKRLASVGLRCFSIRNYIAYYVVDDESKTLIIARIRHQRQDSENLFEEL